MSQEDRDWYKLDTTSKWNTSDNIPNKSKLKTFFFWILIIALSIGILIPIFLAFKNIK